MNDTETPAAQELLPGEMAVEMEPKEQGIVVFDGTGAPLVLIDTMKADEVAEYLVEPIVRRVLVARLRAWADLIDGLA